MMAAGEVGENHLSTMSHEQVTTAAEGTDNNPNRSGHNNRSHNQSDYNNRHQTKSQSTSPTYVSAPIEQDEVHVQTRSSNKRQPIGVKGNTGKVVAATKRARHS